MIAILPDRAAFPVQCKIAAAVRQADTFISFSNHGLKQVLLIILYHTLSF